jgi:hypothetical protein
MKPRLLILALALVTLLTLIVSITPGTFLNRYFSGPTVVYGEASQKFLSKTYGFTFSGSDFTCGKHKTTVAGKQWFVICESGINTETYTGIMWRAPGSSTRELQKNFGDSLLSAIKDPTTRTLQCNVDQTIINLGTISGFFSDCRLAPGEEGQNPINISFFYFNESSRVANVIVFSDFGQGTIDYQTFKSYTRNKIKNLSPRKSLLSEIPTFEVVGRAYAGGGGGAGGGDGDAAAAAAAAAAGIGASSCSASSGVGGASCGVGGSTGGDAGGSSGGDAGGTDPGGETDNGGGIDWCAIAWNPWVCGGGPTPTPTPSGCGAGTLNDTCPPPCTTCGCPGYGPCSPYGGVTCTTSTSAAGPGCINITTTCTDGSYDNSVSCSSSGGSSSGSGNGASGGSSGGNSGGAQWWYDPGPPAPNPQVLEAYLDGNNCSDAVLSITCSDSTGYTVRRSDNSTLFSGTYSGNPVTTTPVEAEDTYRVTCTNGGYQSSPVYRLCANNLFATQVGNITANPRSLKKGASTALTWDIENATSTCRIKATPLYPALCNATTCKAPRDQAAQSLTNILATGNTDANDPYWLRNGTTRTMIAALTEPAHNNTHAKGRKTLPIEYSTTFTLQCGTMSTRQKVDVLITDEVEQ